MIPNIIQSRQVDVGIFSISYSIDEYEQAVTTVLVECNDQHVAEARGMQVALCNLFAEPTFADVFESKVLEIDYGTDIFVNSGFEYPVDSGIRHSLSMEAQARLNALFTLFNAHLLENVAMSLGLSKPAETSLEAVLPLQYNAIDDVHTISLDTSDDVKAFCMQAFGYMSYVLNSGTKVKNALRAIGTDVETVSKFKDPRFG